jgi:predicted membrane channel-forming protein YqfA (hemolysin III family)
MGCSPIWRISRCVPSFLVPRLLTVGVSFALVALHQHRALSSPTYVCLGLTGLVVGGTVGVLRSPTPGLWATVSGLQWALLGGTYWGKVN